MHRFLNHSLRSVLWFKRAFEAHELVIKPPFQRNPVWSERQKSALIDTILLEYPVPELYMQELVGDDGSQQHILVDGQQRIRAVLAFLFGEFELDEESPSWRGMKFEDLSPADKKKVYEYNFLVRILPEMPDEQIRAIFQRLNRNTTTLNEQELRHATYWGPFIKCMEELSELDAFDDFKLFSANDRKRMIDTEYISELAVAVLHGPQNKKDNLEANYERYETNFEEAADLKSKFMKVTGELGQLLPNLGKTRWKKKSDFYSLFLLFADKHAMLPLTADKRTQVAEKIISFGESVTEFLRTDIPLQNADANVTKYANAVERAASDLKNRVARQEALSAVLGPILG